MGRKEVRFGVAQSVLTAVVTSTGATGSYNSMHDNFTPLGGAVVNRLLGEIVLRWSGHRSLQHHPDRFAGPASSGTDGGPNGGLSANMPFYNLTTALAMMVGPL